MILRPLLVVVYDEMFGSVKSFDLAFDFRPFELPNFIHILTFRDLDDNFN